MSPREPLLAAARRFASSGRAAAWSARSKLTLDPVYAALLGEGLATADSVADLGCGRGLALALALEARPEGRPAATLRGIERAADDVAIAQRALGAGASIADGDLSRTAIPSAELLLLLDVLHYLDFPAQEDLLDRARAALAPGGRLVVREADAAGGAFFVAVKISERLMALSRGEGTRPFAYRSALDWRKALEHRGLAVEVSPMGARTPFANVLLVGRASP